jgi:ferrochelatase
MNSDNAPVGVLLTNLGTPDSHEVVDVRRYLKEFLSDRRVVSMSPLIWWPLLNLVILNIRPKYSARAYQKIWTDEGSPLLAFSRQQAQALQSALGNDGRYTVELAMRYGKPSIAAGMASLKQRGARQIVVLPLYPQFSHTTTSSTRDAVDGVVNDDQAPPEIHFISQYYAHPGYIAALADSVREHWARSGRADKLLMSFHGIPEDYVAAGDPYAEQCRQTAKLLADTLALSEDEWLLTFQSRVGKKAWLRPYTDKTLQVLAQSGTRSVQIVCPGFSVDCLETLEEIQVENRDYFIEAGGERYEYIPCLNAREDHIQMLASLVREASSEPKEPYSSGGAVGGCQP